MTTQATIDFSAFTAFNAELVGILEKESMPQVADTHAREIKNLTLQGYDAEGNAFQPYKPATIKDRARGGYGQRPVNLRRGQGRLYDLALDGDTLGYADEDTQKIALGQMTGVNGKWGYERDFLDVSDATNEKAAEELAEKIIELIHG